MNDVQTAETVNQPQVNPETPANTEVNPNRNESCSRIFIIFLMIFLEVALIGGVAYFAYNAGLTQCYETSPTTQATTTTTETQTTTTESTATTTTSTGVEPTKYIEEIDYSDRSTKEALLDLTELTNLPMLQFGEYDIDGNVVVNYLTAGSKNDKKSFQQYESAWVVIPMADKPSNLKAVIGYYKTGTSCFKDWKVTTDIGIFTICQDDETEEDYSFRLKNNYEKNLDDKLPVYRFYPTDLTLLEIKDLIKSAEIAVED